MKSKLLVVAGIFFIFFSTALYAAFEDRIVAVVNGDVITLSDLNTTLQPLLERIKKIPEEEKRKEVAAQARMAVMNQLIDRMLIEQEAASLKIAVTDGEVDGVLENLLKAKKISLEKFRKSMAAEGLSLDEYKDEIRRERIKRRVIDRTIRSKLSISEEEIGEYYAKHRDEYEGNEAVRIQQILIVKPKDATGGTQKKLRAQAQAVLKKLKEGESFDLLVATHSQGPALNAGGDLGFVEKGMMFPEVDEAAFSLKEGGISGVLESPVGFHIIRIMDKRGAGIKPIEEVREEIIAKIGTEKGKKKFEEWLKEMREKSHIEIRL